MDNQVERARKVLCSMGRASTVLKPSQTDTLAFYGYLVRAMMHDLYREFLTSRNALALFDHIRVGADLNLHGGPLPHLEPAQLPEFYQRLLDLTPSFKDGKFEIENTNEPTTRRAQSARRKSGSYFTPPELIDHILDRALEPVLDKKPSPAILDPACGSGAFLLAAAKRIARRHQCNETEKSYLRLAIDECVSGYDSDVNAVELCRFLLLWEGEFKEPSPFLARIRVADFLRDRRAPFPCDVIVGNPPWISFAGRAAQPVAAELRAFYASTYEAFRDYPTIHGMFIERAAEILSLEGRLGFIIPSSVSELEGYAPTRRAHDKFCAIPDPLTDFGEGKFPGVTQPCMALISEKHSEAHRAALVVSSGEPWPIARPDLNETATRLLARLNKYPKMPRDLFGERGFQSDKKLATHFREATEPEGRFTTPLREGSDILEFAIGPARVYADRETLGRQLRSPEAYQAVKVLIRQTARFPIAARSDGEAFRNSLLAGFESEQWPADALTSYLNSALVRWYHYQQFRDARQPVMPQLKVGHLRAIPEPPVNGTKALARTVDLIHWERREAIDAIVFHLFDLNAEERALVTEWHANITKPKKIPCELKK